MTTLLQSLNNRDVCIIGGSIVGVCTAYFLLTDLSHDPSQTTITVIEEHKVAGAASGKAGGFLALDWHSPATASLAKLSYQLHQDLAAKYDGEATWGYRKMDSVSMSMTARARGDPIEGAVEEPEPNPALEGSATREVPAPREGVADTGWLNPEADTSVCGTKDTTAQVLVVRFAHIQIFFIISSCRHPRLFTEVIFARAQALGLCLVHGHPEKLARNSYSNPSSLEVVTSDSDERKTIPCTELVLAAGPWTAEVARTLGVRPLPLVSNLPGHSILIRPTTALGPLTVFSSIYNANTASSQKANGGPMTESPELFPRPDGTVYVAGENHAGSIPQSAKEVESMVDEEMIQKLVRASAQISEALARGTVEVKQVWGACHPSEFELPE
jgi:glycine/D-amino acid oxidase-like deaminating enzyme